MKQYPFIIRWSIPISGVILLLPLVIYTRFLFEQADRHLKTELINQAQRVSLAINLNDLEALSGTEADLTLPAYLRLKNDLILTRILFPDSRFLYLMGQREDGSLFVYLNSEPAGSKNALPPGQTYDRVAEPLLAAFSEATAVVESPIEDRGETWASAFIPILEPDSGDVIAMFGFDVEAIRWNQLILSMVLLPLSLALLLTVFVFLSVLFLYYRWKVPASFQHRWLYRHAEFCMALIMGALVTGQVVWIVQKNEQYALQETFERISAARTSYIATYLHELENYHLSGLASFFEASEFVDRQEFLTYTSALSKDPKIQAWEWAPSVLADDLQLLDGQASQDYFFDYKVWELDESGQKIAASRRSVYFPVLYVSPLEGNERALGFDLGSEPIRRSAMEAAARTNSVTVTDPVTLVQETESQVGVLVFKPVLGTGKPPSQAGFVLAVIRMGDLLSSALGERAGSEPVLYIDLFQLRADGQPVYLAGNSPGEMVQVHIQGELHKHIYGEFIFVQPVYAFGKVYAMVVHPNLAFANLFPARAGWITIIIGTIITLLAGSIIALNSNRRFILEDLVAERTEELQKSEQKYRALAESTSAVLWEFDPYQSRWTYISPQITRLTGWPTEDWTHDQCWIDHLHPEDQPLVLQYFSDCTKREENLELEYRFLRPDGSLVWVRDVASIEWLGGQTVKIRGFLIDITEKKQAEETLHLQSTALHSSANAIIITDQQGSILWANPAFSRLTGYPTTEVMGKNPRELLRSGVHDQGYYQQLWDTILAGNIWSGEMVNRKKDGSLYYEEMTIAPVKTGNDKLTHFIAIKQDISERKKAEEKIAFQASLLSQVRNAVIATDLQGKVIYWNSYAEMMYQWKAEEVLGKSILEVNVTEQDLETAGEVLRSVQEMGYWEGEFTVWRKDGSKFPAHVVDTLIVDASGSPIGIAGVSIDISERKQREQELEAIAAISSALRTAQSLADMLPIIPVELMAMFRAAGAAVVLRHLATLEMALAVAEGDFVNGFFQGQAPGMAISRSVIESGEPFVTSDISQEADLFQWIPSISIRAAACIPLVVQDEVIGTLWIGRKDDFLPKHIRLLTSITDIVANAVHRERLRDETLKQLEQLTSLRAIDRKMTTSTDLTEVLRFVLEQVADRLKVDAAAIHLFDPSALKLVFAYGHGFRTREIETTSLTIGEGLLGRVLWEHKTLCRPDLDHNEFARSKLLIEEDVVSYYATPIVIKGQIKGVIEVFHRSRLELENMRIHFLEIIAGQIAIALENIKLLEGLQQSNLELKEAYDATIEGWSRAMDLRDKQTEGHTQRVTKMILQLARLMGMDEAELTHVRRGALLHDIGKLGVPDSILHKPGPLDKGEWEIMHRHPQLAHDMLMPISYLRPAIDIPYCHHEKWDGTGYPRGLRGEEIPVAARIFAVVDVWDALTSDRPYREAWSKDKALAYVREQSGKHFDPRIIEMFFSILEETF